MRGVGTLARHGPHHRTPEFLTWDSFEQPYRTARDYTGFGPFQFDVTNTMTLCGP